MFLNWATEKLFFSISGTFPHKDNWLLSLTYIYCNRPTCKCFESLVREIQSKKVFYIMKTFNLDPELTIHYFVSWTRYASNQCPFTCLFYSAESLCSIYNISGHTGFCVPCVCALSICIKLFKFMFILFHRSEFPHLICFRDTTGYY